MRGLLRPAPSAAVPASAAPRLPLPVSRSPRPPPVSGCEGGTAQPAEGETTPLFRHPPPPSRRGGGRSRHLPTRGGSRGRGRREDPGVGPRWWRGTRRVAVLGRRGRSRTAASASSARCLGPERWPRKGRESFALRIGSALLKISVSSGCERFRRHRGRGDRGEGMPEAPASQSVPAAHPAGKLWPLLQERGWSERQAVPAQRSGQMQGSADFSPEPCPE